MDAASPRAESLLRLPNTEVEQGCCYHPQEVQPSPSARPACSPGWRRHVGTRLQTHLPVAPCCSHHSPFGHVEGLQLCPAVTQRRVALPLVWTPIQFPWKIRHRLSADRPSTGRDPCSRAFHLGSPLWLFLSLATDHKVQYPTCTG